MKNESDKPAWARALLLLLLLALILPSHLIANDRVVTVDEPWWVISGSNFYYALGQQDFENTIYDYHPAVTTTWVVTAGMLSYFPEYRGYGQGYFDVRKPHFEQFLRDHGRQALGLLRNARLIQTALLMALALLGFLLLQLLVGQQAAFLSIALAMTAPFFLGHARLLNHEGMLSMVALVSLLGMQVYLNKDRKRIYLLVSALAFGLAQLTKSSSIVVAGLVGLLLFVGLFNKNEQALKAKIWDAVKTFAIWLGTAALVYFILWPGMWVAPGKMLFGVYGNAFSYAFQGARLDVTGEIQPAGFTAGIELGGIFQYLHYWAISTTPLTWVGLVFALLALFSRGRENMPALVKSTLFYLAALGGLFILLFGVAQGRNAPHYILSSYLSFDVIAGIGWGYAWAQIQARWSEARRTSIAMLVLTFLILAQIGFGLPYAPYYFNYNNPLAKQPATFGYGEGLAEAADYLARKPNADQLRVYAHNGMGTFSFFFPGETLVLKRAYLQFDDFETIRSEMRKSDYLAIYAAVREKQPETGTILTILQDVAPEQIIVIHGVEYVYIYRIADIPEAVYEAFE